MTPGTPVDESNEWICGLGPYCAEPPRWTWAPGNYLGMPAGTAIGEGDLWWCSVDPSLCIENLGKTVVTPQNQLFSVLRTGTGDLDLASAGNLTQWSPYGVYTAGTQAADVATGFKQPRGLFNGSVLGAGGADYEVLSTSQYQAWYPEHGGNLDIAVGGDVVGDQWAEKLTSSDPIRPLPPALQSATGSGARAAPTGKECRRPGGSISAAMCVARRRCSLSGRLHRFRHSGRRQSQHANRR